MIGLIGAMKMEIEGLVDKLVNEKQEMVSGICFHSGEISGTQCVIAQCGPGKVNAAICTEAMLLRYAPSAIINLGVAGGIGPDIRIGDAVIATSVVQHDMDTTALGDAKGFISGLGRILIHTDEKLTRKLWEMAEAVYPAQVHMGIIATGDQFIAEDDVMRSIRETFHADACEMEGGSIGHVCAANGVPFAVFRAISDHADDHADMDFPAFAIEASKRSCALICSLLETME